MENTFTTKTTVDKNYCVIEIYKDHKWLTKYDFHLDKLYLIEGRNIYSDLECKHWGTPENIEEIHNAITKHLLANNHV